MAEHVPAFAIKPEGLNYSLDPHIGRRESILERCPPAAGHKL